MREDELQHALEESTKNANYQAAMFNRAPTGYLIIDNIGAIREINDVGAALLGKDRKFLIGDSLSRFVPRPELTAFLNHYRKSRFAEKPLITELTLRVAGGNLVPVELVSMGFRHTSGTRHYRSTIIDISERRRAEDALRDTQRNYRNLVNSIEGIVWEMDDKGNFTFVSHQAESMIGYPLERWMREPQFWRERIHPEDLDRVQQAYERGLENGRNFVIEFRMHDAERRVVWLRNSVSVVHLAPESTRLRGVMVNITELKNKEAALRDETQVLEVLNRMGTSLAGELDMRRLVAEVTEAGTEVTGAKFGAFSYRELDGHREEFSLFTTSDASRDIFDRLPLPAHRPGAPPADESEVVRIADTWHDSRAPKPLLPSRDTGRTVMRSYLAMPVVSRSGELLGGLLFGHPNPGVFTERSQRLLVGISAQAAVALDNARLYHAVLASEAHFRQMADAMPQIVWTAQPDGRVNYFNRRWYEFTGAPEGKIGKDGWLEMLHEEDRARCNESWHEALASGHRFQTQCRLRERNSDKYPWHLIRAAPVLGEDGKLAKWFGTCTNIDEQKQAERAVRQMNAALEQRVEERTAQLQVSNRELEAFNYSVSHDLRAPLRSISAFSQLLDEDYHDKLDDQGKDYLRIIGESTQHMTRLIDGLLHLSRITRGDIHCRMVDLGKLAEEIIGRLRQAEPERVVETVIAPDMQVDGDEGLLRIALENLLSNAWKFTAKVPQARIEFGSEMQAQGLVYYVRDNGAGFDMAYSGKLFGAFMRLHTTAEFPGHGIGLAIVQRIINRHGGRIWARAAVDHGATFYFVLPKAG